MLHSLRHQTTVRQTCTIASTWIWQAVSHPLQLQQVTSTSLTCTHPLPLIPHRACFSTRVMLAPASTLGLLWTCTPPTRSFSSSSASSSASSASSTTPSAPAPRAAYPSSSVAEFERNLRLAEEGDAVSQCIVAKDYLAGEVVARDGVRALAFLERAAQQGHAVSQTLLGILYRFGSAEAGVGVDATRAFAYLRRAATNAHEPHPRAMALLAALYKEGAEDVVVADAQRATHWMLRAVLTVLHRRNTLNTLDSDACYTVACDLLRAVEGRRTLPLSAQNKTELFQLSIPGLADEQQHTLALALRPTQQEQQPQAGAEVEEALEVQDQAETEAEGVLEGILYEYRCIARHLLQLAVDHDKNVHCLEELAIVYYNDYLEWKGLITSLEASVEQGLRSPLNVSHASEASERKTADEQRQQYLDNARSCFDIAVDYFQQAIDLYQSPEAYYRMAVIYEKGEPDFQVTPDVLKVLDLLRQAAQQDHVKSIHRLARLYLEGYNHVDEDDDEDEAATKTETTPPPTPESTDPSTSSLRAQAARASSLPRPASVNPTSNSATYLAPNMLEYKMWLERASLLGHTTSQFELGLLNHHGVVDPQYQQEQKAKRQLAKAMNPHQSNAKEEPTVDSSKIPMLIARDEKKAFEWYLKAAEANYTPAMLAVSVCYKEGVGTSKSTFKSISWQTRALDILKKSGKIKDEQPSKNETA